MVTSSGGVGPSHQNGVSQVSLIHSSESVRTVMPPSYRAPKSSTTPFVSATSTLQRMSKPPVRVVAQPPPPPPSRHHHIIPTMQVQPTMASQIKRTAPVHAQFQTHSETTSSDFIGAKPQSVEIVQRVRAVRRQVADEETELRRLRELEHETTQLRDRNLGREKELAVQSSMLNEVQFELRNASMRAQALNRHLEEMYRRRQTAAAAALVEQRKMQQQLARAQNAPAPEVVRPRASVEPFQVVQQQHSPHFAKVDEFAEKAEKESDAIDGLGVVPPEPTYLAPAKTSPSPAKDPNPNSAQKTPCLSTFAPPTSFEQKINSSTMSFGESLDESRLRTGKTDLVSLRSDSLKATKRRSWAASEGTSMSEAEMIHRLLDEQRRGRSHFIPQLPTSQEEPIVTETVVEEVPETKAPVEVPEPVSEQVDTTTEEDASSCSTRSDDVEMEVERKAVKGILRRPNEKMNKGRIEFDPLALLLDAALEGELDLVRTSAAKLTDVSQANDEGITALHNAICAGHYEIVRFLIEHDADVNAQDSDGWTPLHCAASCNNLPMVRQLVEGGGCVLASTLSDMETPVEKCEEDEDGYDGCLKYLLAAHNSTGTVNGARVYAAYGYEAQYEDELSFEAGDELAVLAKDAVDKHWWTCRKANGEQGQVPRTYLALYPALKYRKKLNFMMFDLPLESNNNVE